MTAEEARELSDIASAKKSLSSYLVEIEAAAKRGDYEKMFGAIDPRQDEMFKKLGFRVERIGNNNRVYWGRVG